MRTALRQNGARYLKSALILLCIVCLAFTSFSIVTGATEMPQAEKESVTWYPLTESAGQEQRSNEFILKFNVNGTVEEFSLSFPSTGGIRFHGKTEGYFVPAEVNEISYVSSLGGIRTTMTAGNGTTAIFQRSQQAWKWELQIYNSSNTLVTTFKGSDLAYGYNSAGVLKKVRVANSMAADEVIYGFGERFNSLNRRGISTVLWNKDSWSADDDSYKNIPLMHSSAGYTLFFDSAAAATVDIGATESDKYFLDFCNQRYDFYVWTDSPLQNLNSYCTLTGSPILAPKWALRFIPGGATLTWGESGNMWKLEDAIEGYKKYGIDDIAAFYGETGYNENTDAYEYLAETGTRLLNWVHPIHSVQGMLEDIPYGSLNYSAYDLLMPSFRDSRNPNTWLGGAERIDFSNPTSKTLIRGRYLRQATDGYGFLLDYGEDYPELGLGYNNMTGVEMHNFTIYYYHQAYNELMTMQHDNTGDFLLFARNAAIGSQRWACNTHGDQQGDFDGLKKAICGSISLDTCGFSLAGSDIGGLGATQGPEVSRRWYQFSTFEGLMRAHGTDYYENPWSQGDELATLSWLDCYWLRENLLDKNYSSNIESHLYGKPITQAMALAFPGHKTSLALQDQYIFSDDILVATVSDSGVYHRTVDLPNGNWTDLRTGKVYEGGKTYDVDAPQNYIPLFIRGGSAFEVRVSGKTLNLFDSMSDKDIVNALMVTAPSGSRTTEFWTDVDNHTTFTNAGEGNVMTVTADKAQSTRVIIAQGINAAGVTVDGTPLNKLNALPTEGQTGYFVDGHKRTVIRVANDWSTAAITLDKCNDTNYASGASVVATGIDNKDNITDGKLETSATVSDINTASFTTDLGAVKNISEVEVKWNNFTDDVLYWYKEGVTNTPIAPNIYSVDYTVSVSTDGTNYTDVAKVNGKYNTVDTVKFAATDARYVKISAMKAYVDEENRKLAENSGEDDNLIKEFHPAVYEMDVYGANNDGQTISLAAVTDETGGYVRKTIDNSKLAYGPDFDEPSFVPYEAPATAPSYGKDTVNDANYDDGVGYGDANNTGVTLDKFDKRKNVDAFKNRFTVYHGDNAAYEGLSKVDFANYLDMPGDDTGFWGYISSKCSENRFGTYAGEYGKYYENLDKYVTSCIDQTRKYKNFRATFTYHSSWYFSPVDAGIVFGVKDPTKWVNTKVGGMSLSCRLQPGYHGKTTIAGYDTNKDEYVEYTDPDWRVSYYLPQGCETQLILVVKDGKASITVSQNGTKFAWSQALPECYDGGYVGVYFRDDITYMSEVSINEVTDKEVIDEEEEEYDDEDEEEVTTIIKKKKSFDDEDEEYEDEDTGKTVRYRVAKKRKGGASDDFYFPTWAIIAIAAGAAVIIGGGVTLIIVLAKKKKKKAAAEPQIPTPPAE